jgi:FkbM family methyltransferase
MHQVETRYGRFLVPDIDQDIIGRFLSEYGEWADLEIQFLSANVPADARVADIGAFVGSFGIGLSHRRKLKAVCFVEANAALAPLLRQNVESNCRATFSILEALIAPPKFGLKAGWHEPANIGSTSFLGDEAGSGKVEVPPPNASLSLQELIRTEGEFDLFKLDVEGMEYAILQGGRNWLKQTKASIWIECNEHSGSLDVADLLLGHGFGVYFFAFPSFNKKNFRKSRHAIYPFAYEAGLLATRGVPKIASSLVKSGCFFERIPSREALRSMLWRTPRWVPAEWAKGKPEEALAVAVRTLRGQSYAKFLDSSSESVASTSDEWSPVLELKEKLAVADRALSERANAVEQFKNELSAVRAELDRSRQATVHLNGLLEAANSAKSTVEEKAEQFERNAGIVQAELTRVQTHPIGNLWRYATHRFARVPAPMSPRKEIEMPAPEKPKDAARLKLAYGALMVLAKQRWLFPERQIRNFKRSAQKRADRMRGAAQPPFEASGTDERVNGTAPQQCGSAPATEDILTQLRIATLSSLRPLEHTIKDYLAGAKRLPGVTAGMFDSCVATAFANSSGEAIISISQDNYRENVGGVQLCLAIEEAEFRKRGDCYIHLSPAKPLPVLSLEASAEDYHYVVLINGELLGQIKAADLIDVLRRHRAHGVRFRLVVHHLLGHSPEITGELSAALESREALFWIHDYFALCPNYLLMRNAVSFCASPPAGSAGCGICFAGQHRAEHLARVNRLLAKVAFVMVAPSSVPLEVWRRGAAAPNIDAIVQEHCEIARGVARQVRSNRGSDAPVRVAFLGLPNQHKGWPLYCEIVKQSGPDFEFHHLGKYPDPQAPSIIKFTPVSATDGDWTAMSRTVADMGIDVAFLCSLWPETYNFTAVEAIVGGAFIVTLSGSGNIAALVRKHDCGLVFDDFHAIREAFADGSLAVSLRAWQAANSEPYLSTFSQMSAGLLPQAVAP